MVAQTGASCHMYKVLTACLVFVCLRLGRIVGLQARDV